MSPEEVDRIIQVLTDRLGPSAQYAFELALRQVYIANAVWGIVALGLIVGGAITVRVCYQYEKREYGDSRTIEAVMGMMLGSALIVVGLIAVPFILTDLLNPEWAALRNMGGLWPQ